MKLELLLSDWCQQVFKLIGLSTPEQLQAVGIDGKLLCGSSKQKASPPHLLAGLSHQLGLVLGQVAVSEKSNEITACFDWIEMLVLEGLVITGDAMFTQRHIAEKIISKRGD